MGLGVVLVAQLCTVVPIATAMMLVGCGATQILATGSRRSQRLTAVNLMVYAALVCFAIAAQTHTAISGPASRVGLLLWLDHSVAVLLLAATVGLLSNPRAIS